MHELIYLAASYSLPWWWRWWWRRALVAWVLVYFLKPISNINLRPSLVLRQRNVRLVDGCVWCGFVGKHRVASCWLLVGGTAMDSGGCWTSNHARCEVLRAAGVHTMPYFIQHHRIYITIKFSMKINWSLTKTFKQFDYNPLEGMHICKPHRSNIVLIVTTGWTWVLSV